ncbi:MAG: hypothetical protein JWR37_407 [Mycobacterium sp.]|jgi:hypothetical protein|nr:hypothetical protein [Mycobacterium sp.]
MALTLDYNDDEETQLLAGLGLPAAAPGATDPEVVKATIADLAADEQSEENQPGGDVGAPSAIAAAARRHGLDVVDHDTHEALKRDALEGRRIAAAARQADVEAKVDKAIDRGAITAARKRHWITLLEADPGMEKVLAGIADETAIPLREMGHATDVDVKDLADSSEWFYS